MLATSKGGDYVYETFALSIDGFARLQSGRRNGTGRDGTGDRSFRKSDFRQDTLIWLP